MLKPQGDAGRPIRHRRRERRLWHDGAKHTPSLGCQSCPDRPTCGGLQLDRALFDCLDLCCGSPERCDVVCRRKPADFVERLREIEGFELGDVPPAPVLAAPPIPSLVPMIYHGDKRVGGFAPAAACLSLYKVLSRQDGSTRYGGPDQLRDAFGLARGTPVVLTGTDSDPPLERWWSLSDRRREAIRMLRDLGVALSTTPNYSLFTDQPRWDNLHSMKRIALVYQEFLSEGLPAALHVNARTERDWERWTSYVAARPEVTHIAFEFGTGAGWSRRIYWYADRLTKLAGAVGRPLHLVVRGGARVIPTLAAAFRSLTLVETTVFVKTMYRQRAGLDVSGSVRWWPSPTPAEAALDELLAANWAFVEAVESASARTPDRPSAS